VKRILVADDEPNICTALTFLFERRGYEVRVARNGEEALDLVDSCWPDLVLLDVMMPLVNGYDVCRRIRETSGHAAIRIVLLSAKGGTAEVQKGLDAGADLYVVKPFSTGDLVEKITGLLAAG
jgi:two-component system alkaline phosphatase synthesis response regulator PhoP